VWANGGGAFPFYEAAVSAGQLFMESPTFTSLPLGGGIEFPMPNILGNPNSVNNLQSLQTTPD
jgi:hypothetical protein